MAEQVGTPRCQSHSADRVEHFHKAEIKGPGGTPVHIMEQFKRWKPQLVCWFLDGVDGPHNDRGLFPIPEMPRCELVDIEVRVGGVLPYSYLVKCAFLTKVNVC